MRLHDIAHSRAGDKGDTSDISVIAYRPEDYELLRTHLTSQRVADHFHDIVHGAVDRYEIPQLFALKFVLHAALGSGVSRSLNLDPHGKALSSARTRTRTRTMTRHSALLRSTPETPSPPLQLRPTSCNNGYERGGRTDCPTGTAAAAGVRLQRC